MITIVRDVDDFFREVNHPDPADLEQFANDVNERVLRVRPMLIDPMACKRVFVEPYTLRNRMTRCAFRIRGLETFPLAFIRSTHPLIFSERIPSLTMFRESSACTAIFTRSGEMTITGGKSLLDTRNSILVFAWRIYSALNRFEAGLGETLTIERIRIMNLCGMNRVGGNIRIYEFIDHMRSLGFMIKYEDEVINIPKLYPLYEINPSIIVTLTVSGGVNILGCKKANELQWAAVIVANGLLRFIDRPQRTERDWILYRRKRLEELIVNYRRGKKKKSATIAFWTLLTKEKGVILPSLPSASEDSLPFVSPGSGVLPWLVETPAVTAAASTLLFWPEELSDVSLDAPCDTFPGTRDGPEPLSPRPTTGDALD